MKCSHCDSVNLEIRDGKGPHFSALYCQKCQRFIKWLSQRQDEQLGNSVRRLVQTSLFDVQ